MGAGNLWGAGLVPEKPRERKWWEAVPGALQAIGGTVADMKRAALAAQAQARRDEMEQQENNRKYGLERDKLTDERAYRIASLTHQGNELAETKDYHRGLLGQQEDQHRLREEQDRRAAAAQALEEQLASQARNVVPLTQTAKEWEGVADHPLMQPFMGRLQTAKEDPLAKEAGEITPPGIGPAQTVANFNENLRNEAAGALASIAEEKRKHEARLRAISNPRPPEDKDVGAGRRLMTDALTRLSRMLGPGQTKMLEVYLGEADPAAAAGLVGAAAQQFNADAQLFNVGKSLYAAAGGKHEGSWAMPNAVLGGRPFVPGDDGKDPVLRPESKAPPRTQPQPKQRGVGAGLVEFGDSVANSVFQALNGLGGNQVATQAQAQQPAPAPLAVAGAQKNLIDKGLGAGAGAALDGLGGGGGARDPARVARAMSPAIEAVATSLASAGKTPEEIAAALSQRFGADVFQAWDSME